MRHDIALIHKEPGSDYGVSFPGCITVGADLDEARALEVLAFHVEGMTEDGDAIPGPSGLDRVMADRDAVAILIPLEATAVGTVRVDVTIPENLLGRLDRFAAGLGMDRSDFLALASRKAVAEGDGGRVIARTLRRGPGAPIISPIPT